MQALQLSWKRSLATLVTLAVVNGPGATVGLAQSSKPQAPPAPKTPPSLSSAADAFGQWLSSPMPPSGEPALGFFTNQVQALEAFRQRYGLTLPAPVPSASYSNSVQALEEFRKRYGIDGPHVLAAPVKQVRPVEKSARGGKVEAKLNQIILPEVTFSNLPLGEVLRVLRDEAVKRDPAKTGVNFLINPNLHPVALTGAVDPATGLPLAAPPEQFDMATVAVKFSMPLRNVTMKEALDAIVMVADHPIAYSVEDFAVVFSAKPETVAGQPVVLARPAAAPEPAQTLAPATNLLPMVAEPAEPPSRKPESPAKVHWTDAELAEIKPQPFNIDFGTGAPSKQVGPAAVGQAGDFWNAVSVGFNDHHTETDLKFAGGALSPIEVEMANLGGSSDSDGGMGVKSPMLDTFNYPTGNRGGDSTVILHQVPPGKYQVYIYGHGIYPQQYGDYMLTVGARSYGRKQTSHKLDAVRNSKWVEKSQYVKFSGVKVALGESVEILIQPGKPVKLPDGRTVAEALVCGLQLVPEK